MPDPARWGSVHDLIGLLDVEPTGPGTYVAPPTPAFGREVVDGQQLVAQAVVAAGKEHPVKRVASAHLIFSRTASVHDPVEIDLRTVHGGRTFSTVFVELRQGDRVCAPGLLLLDNDAADLLVAGATAPEVAGPEDAHTVDMGVDGRELRIVDDAYQPDPELTGPPEIHAWMRYDGVADLSSRPDLHRALIAQLSGHFHIAAAMRPHPDVGEAQAHRTLSTGNLAITVTFHRDADVGQWLLFSNRNTSASRGLTYGTSEVFTESGDHVASFAVQGMVRPFEQHVRSAGRDHRNVM